MKVSFGEIKEKIVLLKHSKSIQELSKGYSSDLKFIVTDELDKKYVLRLMEIKLYKRKKEEFQLLNELRLSRIKCPMPVEIGRIDELGLCYNIMTYIEGEEAKDYLPYLSEQQQYELGKEAGKELFRIHMLPAPLNLESWHIRSIKKHNRYLEQYKSYNLSFENMERVIHFIEQNNVYLENRPNQFQHDDFHLGNIILNNQRYGGLIDFNNFDWGDPWHDFMKIPIASRVESVPFSIGQIHGYFNDNIPNEFWRIYSIYAAMMCFSSIVWSIKSSPQQLEKFMERINLLLQDHHFFEELEPTWYKDPERV
ncbi:aminoglycoside phosphotransferase family protein [Psychrobacillus sp. FSL W7-1457]|uniref:aminoglycoside phosphotransferase family protein n=1 Tax=Psychrobacillus sp. FSL W7-1457 TaxID=2954547 RepID=UPI00315A516B